MNFPPPLRFTEAPWRAYVRSLIVLAPAFVAWIFATIFLQPRLEMIWERAGLGHSKAQWLMSFSDGCRQSFWYIVTGLVLLFVLVEWRVGVWPSYRRAALLLLTLTLNSLAFAFVLAIATATLAATPVLSKVKAPTQIKALIPE